MAIKKYFSNSDNTITNAFKDDLQTRGTGSNMGASDILEAFVIHGQTSASANSTTAEQARILINFPVSTLISDINAGTVPSSSVQYMLKMYNAPHGNTTPISYSLDINMVESAWVEGTGLDMENYTDIGVSNWISSSQGVEWNNTGSDYLTGNYATSFFFTGGLEDISVDITSLIARFRSTEKTNYGFLLKFPDAIISGSSGSFYTKRFFGRTSDYYFKRPVIEARWDSSRQDNRGNFLLSSSLLTPAENRQTLFLYNDIRGNLQNIPGLEPTTSQAAAGGGRDQSKLQNILVNFYSASYDGTPAGSKLEVVDLLGSTVYNISGGVLTENDLTITGTYTASFATTSTLDGICDVWFSGSTQYYTGSFSPTSLTASSLVYDTEYVTDITNLKSEYLKGQQSRLRVFVRDKNWNPNIYTLATTTIKPKQIESAYYRLYRVIDQMEILPFGTGSYNFTKLSYDISGNYFDLDTTYLEPGYSYGIQFMYYMYGKYMEQPEVFKFRVNNEESS
mgnify:CR=1 FL=1